MKNLSKNELLNIEGGNLDSLINGTLISTLIKGANTFFEIGRSLGSSIRRLISGCKCGL
jgi:hypothetical protein